MQLIELNVNNTNVPFLDDPEGLDKVQIGYDRDSPFNGFKIECKATLTFYCGSGYNALKQEYQNRFVDGIGYLIIGETCNGIETSFKFKLDFSKYRQTTDTIQIGLIEDNEINSIKDLSEVDQEIDEADLSDVYVRNLDIKYKYHSDRSTLKETPYKATGATFAEDINYPQILTSLLIAYSVNPKTETTINELEDGFALSAETVTNLFSNIDNSNNYISVNRGTRIYQDAGSAVTYPVTLFIPAYEPQPIFTNELESGILEITTSGSTTLSITSSGINFLGKLFNFREIVSIGQDYNNPRYTKVFSLSESATKIQNPLGPGLINIPLTNPATPSASNVLGFQMNEGESVWIQYTFDLENASDPAPVVTFTGSNPNLIGTVFTPNNPQDLFTNYNNGTTNWIWDGFIYKQGSHSSINGLIWQYNDISIDINREIDITFTTNKNVSTNVFNNTNDVEAGSTKIKAYKASVIANQLFPNLSYNELEEPKYEDLHISRGDILRDRDGRDKFKISSKKFFENLEKMSGVGLGVFYDNSLTPTYRLSVIEDFYTTNVFKTYSLEYDDVTITVAENMLYKAIEIGYEQNKDANEELHGKNVYQIEGVTKGKNTYSKICEWIASKFLIKRALSFGTGSESKEYDNNLFVFSIDSNNATISDNDPTATIGVDLVFENNEPNVRGLNRKYASLYNLKRHALKWGFGIHKGKTDLSTQKNDANIKEISYNDGIGYINLPNFVKASNDITINDIDVEDKLIPHYLEFSVVMNITEFSELRKNWYGMLEIFVDTDTYYGNIVSCDWAEGVAKFKLIGRLQ
jgi:hypothetical protein